MPWGLEHRGPASTGERVGATQLPVIYDAPVRDAEGERVGVVVGVCRERDGSTWICIRLGLFGLRSVAVPLGDAVLERGVVVLLAHGIVARLRYVPSIADLIDREPRLLVLNGHVVDRELRRAGLTERDLHGLLRQQGVYDVANVRVAIFEERGRVTVVRAGAAPDDAPLLRDVLPDPTGA